jgi:hypothetical protein
MPSIPRQRIIVGQEVIFLRGVRFQLYVEMVKSKPAKIVTDRIKIRAVAWIVD